RCTASITPRRTPERRRRSQRMAMDETTDRGAAPEEPAAGESAAAPDAPDAPDAADASAVDVDTLIGAAGPAPEASDTAGTTGLVGIVEALVFASPDPITVRQLVRILDGEATKEDVVAALQELKNRYERSGGLQLVEVANGYQIV